MTESSVAGTEEDGNTRSVGVFISWSGEPSKGLSEALSTLIANVFQDVKPFVSSNNIEAGVGWFNRIAMELARTEFGILCLTPANLREQWIHFEAGALAKRIDERARVVPYLHGVSPSDLTPPLSMFNGVGSDREGTLKLLASLNETRPSPFDATQLGVVFDKWWGDFANSLGELTDGSSAQGPPHRTDRDILDELLARQKVRQQDGVPLNFGPGKGDVGATRAQLVLKMADIEMKRLEMEGQPGFNESYVLRDLVHKLEGELRRLK